MQAPESGFDWTALAGVVLGFLLGLITLYLTFRARSAPFQSVIYAEWVRGYGEVIERLSQIHDQILTQLTLAGEGTPQYNKYEVRGPTLDLRNELLSLVRRWLVFFPEEMNAALGRYLNTYDYVLHENTSIPPRDSPQALQPSKFFEEAYINVLRVARATLHSDQLGTETRKLLGRRGVGSLPPTQT